MIVIHNRILPFGKNFLAINLFGIIFAKGSCDAEVLRHEYIHTLQMRETGYIGFYLFYVVEWLVKAVLKRSFFQGYLAISFEREAYTFDYDSNYPRRRRHYAWRHFLRSGRK